MQNGDKRMRDWLIFFIRRNKAEGKEIWDGIFSLFYGYRRKEGVDYRRGRCGSLESGEITAFSPNLTVIAPFILPELLENAAIVCKKRMFKEEDLDGVMFVVAASDNQEVNSRVAALDKETTL